VSPLSECVIYNYQSNLRSDDLKLLCVDMSVAILPMELPTLYYISVSQTLLPFVTFKLSHLFPKTLWKLHFKYLCVDIELAEGAGCPSLH